MAIITLNNYSLSSVTALPAGVGGKVVQVFQSIKTDSTSTTSVGATHVDAGLSVAITPSSSSSKVLIQLNLNNIGYSTSCSVGFILVRGSTEIGTTSTQGGQADTFNEIFRVGGGGMSDPLRRLDYPTYTFLDSPATTSATTYKVQFSVSSGTGYINRWGTNTDVAGTSCITAYEIGA